jgi:hypothetical protein
LSLLTYLAGPLVRRHLKRLETRDRERELELQVARAKATAAAEARASMIDTLEESNEFAARAAKQTEEALALADRALARVRKVEALGTEGER